MVTFIASKIALLKCILSAVGWKFSKNVFKWKMLFLLKKKNPQETVLLKFFCFLTKTMNCYTYRCRNAFTIEDSTAWERDPAHERTGAWSINGRKLWSSSRVHIKTKSKWNICLWSDKLKCSVSFHKCQNVSCWLKIVKWNIQEYQHQVLFVYSDSQNIAILSHFCFWRG